MTSVPPPTDSNMQTCTSEATFPPGLAIGRRDHVPPGRALGHRDHFPPGQACKSHPHVPTSRTHNKDASSSGDDGNEHGQDDTARQHDHEHAHTHTSHARVNRHHVHMQNDDSTGRQAHHDEGHGSSARASENDQVHTSHGHHYGHERRQTPSVQPVQQQEAPGNSAYGHSHGHGHGDEQNFTPPGQANSAQDSGSHGRGHDH